MAEGHGVARGMGQGWEARGVARAKLVAQLLLRQELFGGRAGRELDPEPLVAAFDRAEGGEPPR
eukprot:10370608-Alexandrium_andersonii.AAC.1